MKIPWHKYTFHNIVEPKWEKFVEQLSWHVVEGLSDEESFIKACKIYNVGDDPKRSHGVDEDIIMAAYSVLRESR